MSAVTQKQIRDMLGKYKPIHKQLGLDSVEIENFLFKIGGPLPIGELEKIHAFTLCMCRRSEKSNKGEKV